MDVNQREQQTVSYFLDKWNFKQWFLLMLSVRVDGCVVSVHVHCINCICCRCRIMLYYNFLCWFTCIAVVAWCCFSFIMLACLLHRRDIHHKKNASRRVYINVTTTVVKEFEKKNCGWKPDTFFSDNDKKNIIAVALFCHVSVMRTL